MANAQIQITADTSAALRSIQQIEKALGNVSTTANSVERSMSGLTNTMRTLAGAVIGASLFNFVDSLQNVQNKLRIATTSQAEFNSALSAVKAIADKTGQSLVATGDLYASVAKNAATLGYNQEQITTVTNAMATALKASGTSAQGASSVMYQFGQILAKGKVNGDEFTTIMENLGGPVMNVVAKNMGVTTAELIKMKEKGLIGAKDFTDALIRSMNELDQMGGKAVPTLSQNLTKVQNSFGDFIIKLDQATGFTQKLGDGMAWIAKNTDVVVPILAALIGYLAAARIAAFVVEIYRAVAAIRAMGIAAAVSEALITGGISALAGLAGAAAAYAGAQAIFDKVDGSVKEMNTDLNATATAAQNGLGTANGQLTGIADKFTEILKKQKEQLAISGLSAQAYQIENQLLGFRRDLEGKMTAEQEKQLRSVLKQIEERKALVGIAEQQKTIMADIAISYAEGSIQADKLRAIESLRRQYGEEIAKKYGDQITALVEIQKITGEIKKYEQESYIARQAAAGVAMTMAETNSADLDIAIKYNEVLYRLQGTQEILTAEQKKRLYASIEETENAKKRLEYYRQMKQSVESVNKALTGPAAGAMAAGQLGGLDPMTAARTANETLFNGLAQLRADDLISEQQYQTAKVAAAVQANDAIMAAQQKLFETQKMYQLQNDKNSIFGYEQQKQIAADSAKFQMKSDFEKTQFAIENIGSVFSALGAQNKKAFEASKALNIATALMNTYMGATKALATYPWPFGMIAAAAAVAAGLAQVAAIRSQQYSGRALGGPVMGGQSYIVGESGPELFTPATTGSITRNGDLGGGSPVNVNFTIVANDTTGFDQLLASRKGVIQQIISDAMLEKGRRSVV